MIDYRHTNAAHSQLGAQSVPAAFVLRDTCCACVWGRGGREHASASDTCSHDLLAAHETRNGILHRHELRRHRIIGRARDAWCACVRACVRA